MHKTSDYIHPTHLDGRCRVRVYAPDVPEDSHVVVLTELRDNPGQSVLDCVEQLAASVIMENGLRPANTVIIQHYESATQGDVGGIYDLVTFSVTDPEPILWAGRLILDLGHLAGRS